MARILVVCTGNICRSPLAEGFLAHLLRERGISGITVSSAGMIGRDGYPAMPETIEAAVEHGVDVSTHHARRLAGSMIEDADLILGMAAEHRGAVARLVPSAAERAFTLKGFLRLLERLPSPLPKADPEERLRAAVSAANELRAAGQARDAWDDDVADPLGLGLEAYRAVAWELEELTRRLVDVVFGTVPGAERAGRGRVAPSEAG